MCRPSALNATRRANEPYLCSSDDDPKTTLLFLFDFDDDDLTQSFSSKADAEAWVKTSSTSGSQKPVVQSISVPRNLAEKKKKKETRGQRRDACTTTPKTDFDENDDENDGWTTTYEPAKPRGHQNNKGMMETPHPSKRKTTVTTPPPKTNAAKRKLSSSSKSTAMTTRTKTTKTPPTTGRRLRYVLEFDGASRGNPGPAGAGALIRAPRGDEAEEDDEDDDEDDDSRKGGEIIKEICTSLGVATVNEAEYHALLTGLKAAIQLGVQDIKVRGDSNLIVSQVKGEWKVKEPRLIPLHAECNEMKKKFRRFDIAHVRREFNKDADALANSAIDDGTHTNDYEYRNGGSSGGGGFNGGGGEGLGGGNVNAAARMLRRTHYANIARATLCTMRFARIALL